jgi:hypothetical protein
MDVAEAEIRAKIEDYNLKGPQGIMTFLGPIVEVKDLGVK